MEMNHRLKKIKTCILIIGCTLLISIIVIGTCVFLNMPRIQKIQLDPSYNELFSEEELAAKGHISTIPEYATYSSIGYKNEDGSKTLYVYAAPIRYTNNKGQLSIIDTRLANVTDETMKSSGYPYTIASSDIEPFFPLQLSKEQGIKIKKEIEYEIVLDTEREINAKVITDNNFIGEQKMQVSYKNIFGTGTKMNFYPCSTGANCEMIFDEETRVNKVSFLLKFSDASVKVKKEPGGYLILTKENNGDTEIVGVIQKPLLKTQDGYISYNCSIDFSKADEKSYKIILTLDEENRKEGSTAFIAFEMRREKSPDNALYSKFPDLKYAYLSNYSVIGNSENYGIGRLMTRYSFTKYFDLQESQIQKAYHYIYNLNDNQEKFEMLSVLEDWCSVTGNWNNNYKTGEQTSFLLQKEKILKFDITKEVRKWCSDSNGQMEHMACN